MDIQWLFNIIGYAKWRKIGFMKLSREFLLSILFPDNKSRESKTQRTISKYDVILTSNLIEQNICSIALVIVMKNKSYDFRSSISHHILNWGIELKSIDK